MIKTRWESSIETRFESASANNTMCPRCYLMKILLKVANLGLLKKITFIGMFHFYFIQQILRRVGLMQHFFTCRKAKIGCDPNFCLERPYSKYEDGSKEVSQKPPTMQLLPIFRCKYTSKADIEFRRLYNFYEMLLLCWESWIKRREI